WRRRTVVPRAAVLDFTGFAIAHLAFSTRAGGRAGRRRHARGALRRTCSAHPGRSSHVSPSAGLLAAAFGAPPSRIAPVASMAAVQRVTVAGAAPESGQGPSPDSRFIANVRTEGELHIGLASGRVSIYCGWPVNPARSRSSNILV